MKSLVNYINQDNIQEGLKLGSSKIKLYKEFPKDLDELREILKERLEKDKNADLNDIDISKISNMGATFMYLDPHNIKIDLWDVSHVVDMTSMFAGCKNFNCDISRWDVKSSQSFNNMFYQCENFDCNISNWKIDKHIPHHSMFIGCDKMTWDKKPNFY